jgi:iron-sulfur cluster assembly protein
MKIKQFVQKIERLAMTDIDVITLKGENVSFSLTKKAIIRIRDFLKKKNNAKGFRVGVEEAGCTGWKYIADIVDDKLKNNDIELPAEDFILYVAKDSAKILNGAVLNCVEKGLGMWQWEFDNPNVNNKCGCGESFSIKTPEQQ